MPIDTSPQLAELPAERISPDAVIESGQEFKPDKKRLLPWQTPVPTSAIDAAKESLYNIEKEGISTGLESGTAAAKALFNANTSGFAKALSSRANAMFSHGVASNRLRGELTNIKRQARDLKNVDSNLAQIDSMRKVNYAGQIRFADQVANYQNELEKAKLGALGAIIGGGMSALGFAAGGGK